MSIFSNIFGSDKPARLFVGTDIHSHVCPGIDDGSPRADISVEMVAKMHEIGVERMFVTPHVADETFPNDNDTIKSSFDHLTRAVAEAGIPMQLDFSAEYRIGDLLSGMLKNGTARFLPGRHILVENPWLQEPYGLDEFFYTLQTEYDLKPILAHPERYRYYQVNPRRYKTLHDRGIFFQVNLLSLAGHYDKACRKTAEMLLESNMVDFIGSDIHRPQQVDEIADYIRSNAYKLLLSRADSIRNDIL